MSALPPDDLYRAVAASCATSLLENSQDLLAAIDKELRFVALNQPFQREFELVFGIALQSGQRLNEVLSHLSQDRNKAVALCRRALAGESFRVIEDFGDERLLRKSYELAFTPIFDTHHQPILAALVLRDLTLQRGSERRFNALLEAAPDATLIMRADGAIDLANEHAARMFGFLRHQMLGMPIERLLPERLRARHIAQRHQYAIHPAARPMGGGKTQLVGLRADGSEFPVEISLNPLDVDGNQMVVAAIRDMTVRQRAEDQLRALSRDLERRIAERTAELQTVAAAFSATFEQAAVGIAHIAPDGTCLRVNQRLCDIVGYTKEELRSMTFQDITHPDDLDIDDKLLYAVLAGTRRFYSVDKRYLMKSGAIVWVNLNLSLVRDTYGTPQYFISVVKEVNARKQDEFELQKSKECFALAIDATGLGMFDYYPQTGEVHWTVEMKRHFGLSPSARVDDNVFFRGIHPEDRKRVAISLENAMRDVSNGRFHIEHRAIGIEDGLERWLDARGKIYFDRNQSPVRFIGTVLDITEKKRADERIRHAAFYDTLTGLPNRGLLFDYAKHMFGRARRSRHNCAVLFIDLDRFKPINDNHGHEVGDHVLKQVAERLQECIRAEDLVFRLGGDEFVVLLQEVADDTSAKEVARHMSQRVNQPYHIDSLVLSLSLSVGISVFPRDGKDLDTLLSKADAAMYHAKQAGRNCIQFYCEELAAQAKMQARIEEKLHTALNHDEFRLHYQPVIDMHTGRLTGVEALLRWPNDDIGPEMVVRVAEATGQINRLCDWVINEACRQHKDWRDRGLPAIPIAINVSAVHFRQKDFAQHFSQILAESSVSAAALQIEVTEAGLIENADRASGVLESLRELGITVTLDDFGMGFSSLKYLSGLPLNRIKVDRSFVQDIEDNPTSRAITEAIIALGRTLNLEVVAEGIESEAALHYLRGHGCDQAQGFHVCEPVSAETFEAWFKARSDSFA